MSEQTYKYINYGNNFANIHDKAFDFSLEKKEIDEKYYSIFDLYDTNHDETLDKSELEKLKKDIDEANNDDDKSTLSSKETSNLLQKLFPNQKISKKIVYGFFKAIQTNYRNIIENVSDGVIDWTAQGREGDCWLLTEVRALSNTQWGADAIKNSISNNTENKTYTVTLKGVNFTCDISYDEIKKERKNKNRPRGDIDMLLLELATEKFFKQEVAAGRMENNPKGMLYGGYLMGDDTMQYLLTGNRGHVYYFQSERKTEEEIDIKSKEIEQNETRRKYYQKYKDNISNLYEKEAKIEFMKQLAKDIKNCSVTCSFKHSSEWELSKQAKRSEKKDTFNNQKRHAFVVENIVTDADGNIVDIIMNNPWNPNTLIHKSLDEFIAQVDKIAVTTEHDNYEDLNKLSEPCWVKL